MSVHGQGNKWSLVGNTSIRLSKEQLLEIGIPHRGEKSHHRRGYLVKFIFFKKEKQ